MPLRWICSGPLGFFLLLKYLLLPFRQSIGIFLLEPTVWLVAQWACSGLSLSHIHTRLCTHTAAASAEVKWRGYMQQCVCVCVCLLTVTYFYGAHSLRMIKILQFFLLLCFLPPFNLSLTPSPLSSSLHPPSHHSFQVSFFLIPLLYPVSHFYLRLSLGLSVSLHISPSYFSLPFLLNSKERKQKMERKEAM